MATAEDVALRIAHAFEELGIPYFLGGSMASSVQGEPRSTNDIDFVIDLKPGGAAALASTLGPDFDVDVEALDEAAKLRRSWNIYFLPTPMKIDLFILRTGPFDQSEFQRRRTIELEPGRALYVKSPEDSVVRKLLWYRDGGEVSSQQWRDVIEVLRVSGPWMDMAYVDRWSTALKVADLLARAKAQAALD